MGIHNDPSLWEEGATVDVVDEPVIELGRGSRWVDEKGRIFIIFATHDPQIHNGRLRSTWYDFMDVNREYSHLVSRADLESWIRAGTLTRITTDFFL